MGNKEDLQEMLDKLSEDELSTLGDLIGKASNKPRNTRQRRGRKKKEKTSSPPPKQPNFLNDINLSADEQKELKEASKFDKEKGVDKPKTHGIIPKSSSFKKVSTQCMDCKKTFEISASLIPPERGRYKCNSCICRGRSQ